jgi:hypothetical protein
MNTISRVHSISESQTTGRGSNVWRAVRIEINEREETSVNRVTLSPGDRLIIVNRTRGRLTVSPLDYFGNSFARIRLEPAEASPALMVTGLWFQIDLHSEDRRSFPMDVYLAPNRVD